MKRLALPLALIIFALSATSSLAAPIDIEAMDFVFDRFEGLSSFKKALAYQYMEGAMNSESSLESFKGTADWLLNEERLALLEKNGITRSDIFGNLDALKTWTREDRFALVAAFKEKGRDQITALNEKYTPRTMFSDMGGHWAREAVEAMASAGLINGRGGGIFDPEAGVTRAEFAAMLVRLAERIKTMPQSAALLRDVPSGSWYEAFIRKAYLAGILRGDGKGYIRPTGAITRQEMAVMAVNLSKAVNMDIASQASLSQFTDSAQTASWAKDPMAKASSAGWINGMGNGKLEPQGSLTRAQAAQIVKRIYDCIN